VRLSLDSVTLSGVSCNPCECSGTWTSRCTKNERCTLLSERLSRKFLRQRSEIGSAVQYPSSASRCKMSVLSGYGFDLTTSQVRCQWDPCTITAYLRVCYRGLCLRIWTTQPALPTCGLRHFQLGFLPDLTNRHSLLEAKPLGPGGEEST